MAADEAIAQVQAQTRLPCTDLIRYDAHPLLDTLFNSPYN